VEGYARLFSRRTGIAVRTENNEIELRLQPEIETNLFRIVQEALANCAKHSRATSIHIGQSVYGDSVKLDITDDGMGFDATARLNSGSRPGHGLTTMQQRAEFIGARFNIETGPGSGTCIAVEIMNPEPQFAFT
jgi:signal transduction histidine kinase